MNHLKSILCTLPLMLMVVGATTTKAQTACSGWNNPTSFSFTPSDNNEQYSGQTGNNTYTAPNCTTGTTGVTLFSSYPASQLATITDAGSPSYCGSSLEGSKQFRIMRPGVNGEYANDPLVGNNPSLPVVPPSNFGNFTSSIRLGNCQIDAHAEALYYDFDVTPDNSLFNIYYAIVAQTPGHGLAGDPALWIRILRESTPGSNTFVPINTNYCYNISSTPASSGGSVTIGQDGWHSYGSGYDCVYYREWTHLAINLHDYLYRRVRVEIINSDCTASGHYGYAYIAGSCQSTTPSNYNLQVSSSNAAMGTGWGSGTYEEQSVATIAAVPTTGHQFTHWNDNNQTNPRVVTLTHDTTFVAHFEAWTPAIVHDTVIIRDTIPYDLTYHTLSVISGNINRGLVAGNGEFPHETCIEIAAIPLEGNRFIQWHDGNTENPRSVTLTTDATYVATFEASTTGVSELELFGIAIGTEQGQINVIGAQGQTVRIYDVSGHCLTTEARAAENHHFRVPATGTYFVQVGDMPAKKVVVLR
ncbi:MAG: hypothetical protein HUK17_06470 [Bacteroidales bacterium]|nr:hypothetical protein [Bacteroidales bacterium]